MILAFGGKRPKIDRAVFVADTATLIGDVELGSEAVVLFGAVLRADTNRIKIGSRSNIQDLSVLHVDSDHALTIGESVTVGHRAILHGCTIGDRVIAGMGTIVMNGVVVGEDSLIGAGSVVTEGTIVPPRSLVVGLPAKVKRSLTNEEVAGLIKNADHYVELGKRYRSGK